MRPTIFPYLSYRDTAAALRFLEQAFGFTTNVRWEASDGTVQHAEVTFGDGAVMMGTADHPAVPLDGTSVGQGLYVYVEDVDAHFAQAQAGGSGRVSAGGYRVGNAPLSGLDPEGYEWSFGSYRPETAS
jgi:uncharacterized glyoxalase superfamily protein PhnB